MQLSIAHVLPFACSRSPHIPYGLAFELPSDGIAMIQNATTFPQTVTVFCQQVCIQRAVSFCRSRRWEGVKWLLSKAPLLRKEAKMLPTIVTEDVAASSPRANDRNVGCLLMENADEHSRGKRREAHRVPLRHQHFLALSLSLVFCCSFFSRSQPRLLRLHFFFPTPSLCSLAHFLLS